MQTRKFRQSAAWISCALAIVMLLAPNYLLSKDSFKPFKLKTPEGNPKLLQDYLKKATLVTFFFPTCGYCNAEFPHLQRIYDKYREQGFSLVSINIVPDQNSQVAEWQTKHQYTFPVLIGASLESVQKDYDLQMTPTHFLLDSKGKVILKQSGYQPGDEKILEDRIQQALNPAP